MPESNRSTANRKTPLTQWRHSRSRRLLAWSLVAFAVMSLLAPAPAQELSNQPLSLELPESLSGGPQQ